MSAGSARTVIPVLAILVVAGMLAWYFGRQHTSPSEPSPTSRSVEAGAPPPITSPVLPNAPPNGSIPPQPQQSAALPGPQDVARVSPGSPQVPALPRSTETPPGSTDAKLPSFDVVRVEPTGESVIAGRAAPGATVELLRNGQPFARVLADGAGLFAIVPPELPAGSHEFVLQAITPDSGGRTRSAQSVTVVIAGDRKQKPLVTVTAPDQPTIVLSRPDDPVTGAPSGGTVAANPRPSDRAAASASAPPAKRPDIRIATVEAEGTGRMFVSGQAAPGATIRLYLNDAYVAPSGTGPDGRLSFSIERGIRPGEYRVRLDDVDPVTGAVRSRAEVPFTVPVPAAVAAGPVERPTEPNAGAPSSASRASDASPARPAAGAQGGALVAGLQPGPGRTGPGERPGAGARVAGTQSGAATEPGQVIVPEINTAIVARGDNLWRISRRVYGEGLRYTVIYGANSPQIRNPDLIYPGQVFVLPGDGRTRP